MLREIERRLKFADMLAACLHDKRDPTRTIHTQATMIRERMLAIYCGYEDCVRSRRTARRHQPSARTQSPDKIPAINSADHARSGER